MLKGEGYVEVHGSEPEPQRTSPVPTINTLTIPSKDDKNDAHSPSDDRTSPDRAYDTCAQGRSQEGTGGGD